MSAPVAITFDNLGEVSDLERGRWPDNEPIGRHFSVTRALPRVLDLLATLDLRATFFVEGLNAELYPLALREIAAAGHEIGLHGWRHEAWAELEPAPERALIARGAGALEELGLRPLGFRPPGGALTPSSLEALADAGFRYCSPAGQTVEVRAGLAVLPFRWEVIDAFHYLPHFAPRRQASCGSPEVLPPSALRAAAGRALEIAADGGDFLALLFHPFLADTDERLEAIRAVLTRVRDLVAAGTVWCASMAEIAAWALDGP